MTMDEIIATLARNNAGEQTAIEGYFSLLSDLRENKLPNELIAQIEEIISDEMNHSNVLSEWIVRLSEIQPNET